VKHVNVDTMASRGIFRAYRKERKESSHVRWKCLRNRINIRENAIILLAALIPWSNATKSVHLVDLGHTYGHTWKHLFSPVIPDRITSENQVRTKGGGGNKSDFSAQVSFSQIAIEARTGCGPATKTRASTPASQSSCHVVVVIVVVDDDLPANRRR